MVRNIKPVGERDWTLKEVSVKAIENQHKNDLALKGLDNIVHKNRI